MNIHSSEPHVPGQRTWGLRHAPAWRSEQPRPWIEVASGAPYFRTDAGEDWTPIGQNDSISWEELGPLFRRHDLAGVESHLRWLVDHGVTCLRLMLECAHARHRYLERPAGVFVPAMVRLWDDVFTLCERVGLRILLTPYDTFWMWMRWKHHPYNRKLGGPLARMSRALLCDETRDFFKRRLTFAVERWGGSGALFAWDLWNEIHPAHAEETAECFGPFIRDLSEHVRTLEKRLYGRAHLQTVSLFGPELRWRRQMPLREPIFRNPDLDFATIHIYEEGTIDYPRDTVAPARSMGRIVRECLGEIRDGRPFLDTEHGPIHLFKDRKKTLSEAFDDEYFRHMQWAHFASGGAGGGMRWPNRSPHTLTTGMREAQRALVRFLPLIDWSRFVRRNINDEVLHAGSDRFASFACADDRQAIVWLLRTDTLRKSGRVDPTARGAAASIRLASLPPGSYRVTSWNTETGMPVLEQILTAGPEGLEWTTGEIATDLAIAIKILS